MKGPEFLKKRFNLHAAPEVEKAAKRTAIQTGEKVSQNPAEKIQNYLDRFKELVERKDDEKKKRGLLALKKVLHDAYVIKQDDIPESYFALQQQIAREQGHGTIEITPELRKEAINVIQTDQRASLDEWIDYLASDDALYPDWTKYWAFRSVLGMALFDKEKMQFGNRSKHTTAKFPDLNREALAYVVDLIEKRARGEHVENPIEDEVNAHAGEEKLVSDDDFQKLLTTENFARYYAFAIEHVVSDNTELFKNIKGKWQTFNRGSDPHELVTSIQGHGTGWCTAGEHTAAMQLGSGDFHLYRSNNAHGVPTIPRLAIRMANGRIAEVRGVAHQQEIDPYIAPVLTEKLQQFGKEGEEYKQKAEDMKTLTLIDAKIKQGEPLNRDEIIFIYEIDHPIRGFGYQGDPRINEIKQSRNRFEDAKVIVDAEDDIDCVLKLARSTWEKEEVRRVATKIVGMRHGDDQYDFEGDLEDFLLPELSKKSGLPDSVAIGLIDLQMPRLVLKASASFEFKDKFLLLNLLHTYDAEHKSTFMTRMAGSILKDASPAERLALVNEHPSADDEVLKKLLQGVDPVPVGTIKKLIAHEHTELVSSMLRRCEIGLTSAVALALIGAGHMAKVAANFRVFKNLNADVYGELDAGGYKEQMKKHRDSFDSRMEKNPFGQYLIKDPFDD